MGEGRDLSLLIPCPPRAGLGYWGVSTAWGWGLLLLWGHQVRLQIHAGPVSQQSCPHQRQRSGPYSSVPSSRAVSGGFCRVPAAPDGSGSSAVSPQALPCPRSTRWLRRCCRSPHECRGTGGRWRPAGRGQAEIPEPRRFPPAGRLRFPPRRELIGPGRRDRPGSGEEMRGGARRGGDSAAPPPAPVSPGGIRPGLGTAGGARHGRGGSAASPGGWGCRRSGARYRSVGRRAALGGREGQSRGSGAGAAGASPGASVSLPPSGTAVSLQPPGDSRVPASSREIRVLTAPQNPQPPAVRAPCL